MIPVNVVIVSDCADLGDIQIDGVEITLLKVPYFDGDILTRVFERMGKYPANRFIIDVSNSPKLDIELVYKEASQYGYNNIDVLLPYESPTRLVQLAESYFEGFIGVKVKKITDSSIEVFLKGYLKELTDEVSLEDLTALIDEGFKVDADVEGVYTDGQQKVFKGNCLIAIAGANEGLGVTHTCLMLAGFLVSRGYRVALLDFNKQNPMNFELAMVEKEEVTSIKARGKCTTIGGVDIYSSNDLDLFAYRRMDYDFILQDLGALSSDRERQKFILDTILTATKSFIVCSASFWRLADISMVKSVIPQGVSVVSPLANKADAHDLRALVGRRCFIVPSVFPFEICEVTENICMDMLGDIIPQRKKGLLGRFFG